MSEVRFSIFSGCSRERLFKTFRSVPIQRFPNFNFSFEVEMIPVGAMFLTFVEALLHSKTLYDESSFSSLKSQSLIKMQIPACTLRAPSHLSIHLYWPICLLNNVSWEACLLKLCKQNKTNFKRNVLSRPSTEEGKLSLHRQRSFRLLIK